MMWSTYSGCVEAVEYLHSMGISHGGAFVSSPAFCVAEADTHTDLDLSNFVLGLPEFSTLTETEVVSKLFSDPKRNVTKVKMKDGMPP